jgi:hypothetical protein
MSCVRRFLGWLLLVTFLGGVGFGVFHFVRYRPRFTIPELLFVEHLSADGSRLVTIKPPGLNRANVRGPVQVWDTHGGRLLNEFFGDAPAWFEFSPDSQTVAAGLDDGTLHLIDWRSGRDWRIDDVRLTPLTERPPWPRHWFSRRGRWLYVDSVVDTPGCIIDVASRRVVLRMHEQLLHFNNDERFAFVRSGAEIDVWDVQAAKKVASLATKSDWLTESPDGRALLTRRVLTPPTPVDAAAVHGIDVLDLATLKPRFHRELSPPGYWQASYSPDSRTLALWNGSDLALIDANTGRLVDTREMEQCELADFSADGSLMFMRHGRQFDERLTMIDAATGRVLWQKAGRSSREFIGEAGIAHQERGKPVQLIDARSGEVMAIIPNSSAARGDAELWNHAWILDFVQTSDRRHFVFAGRQRRNREPHFWDKWLEKWSPNMFGDDVPALVIMESATGQELLRLANAGNQPIWLKLSDDAGTLVTVDAFADGRRCVRVWDVQPTRAWLWAIGVTAATGIGLLAFRWAWRLRKARKTASKPISLPSIA